MYSKIFATAVLAVLIAGCAERKIDIFDRNGNVIGNCIAGYDWHFYGLQDSIDYMLYYCAKGHIEDGYSISEPMLLEKDFTLPAPPEGKSWNKKLAMGAFNRGEITETKLGYILADTEYEYVKTIMSAEDDLADGKIDKAQFTQIAKNAKAKWLGK